MRSISFTPVLLMVGSFAFADGTLSVDLDRPGALDQIQQEHPQRYQALRALLRASERAPCQSNEIRILEARLNVSDLECGMDVFTTYPALRHLSFELDGTHYAATVVLEDLNKVQPASSAVDSPDFH